MRTRFAALAVCVGMGVVAPVALAQSDKVSPIITLDAALQRVADIHPELRLFGPRRQALDAERERAALKPALRVGADIENVLGSGDARGLHAAEVSLSLAGVFERGGKLDARKTLAQARIDALAVERETRRLDLLAEVARRYLTVLAARADATIAAQDIQQRQRVVEAAAQRLKAGASPQANLLSAEAALAQVRGDEARAQQRGRSARQYLAALWGAREASFDVAEVGLLQLPEIAELEALETLLDDTPELGRFAFKQRIGEARLRLAQSDAASDWDWQFGVRRLQAGRDLALIGSVSMALGSAQRAAPEQHLAEAELAELALEREAAELSLYATLVEAHGRQRTAAQDVRRLGEDVLPRLAKAEAAAERAYRAGALSHLEWAQLQSERVAAQRQQLEAALEAHAALIEIQRLTGQPFLAASKPATVENTP
jgi:cobalt-zinc-cadmium efflux system outer membrane protein